MKKMLPIVKIMSVLLALVMMLSAVPPAAAEQMYPTNVKNGQVLSNKPYKVVERFEDAEIFYVYTYISWERMDNGLITHWNVEEVDVKTGKVNQTFPGDSFASDYFKQKDNKITVYKDAHVLPPFWDRPFTDVQAAKSGKPKVTNWLFDSRFHWAFASIRELFEMNIISAFPDGSFKPNNSITREQFVSILVNAMALKRVQDKSFADVPVNRWSNSAIGAAVQAGIIVPDEYEGRKFEPGKNITREEMAVMLVRAIQKEPGETYPEPAFKDKDSITRPGFVAVAADLKLMNGYPDGTFRPDGQATRAEAAAVIDNFLSQKSVDRA